MGYFVGKRVGVVVGYFVGNWVGPFVGNFVGEMVGSMVGLDVGYLVMDSITNDRIIYDCAGSLPATNTFKPFSEGKLFPNMQLWVW